MHDETLYAERALRAGASGYIMKQSSWSSSWRRSQGAERRHLPERTNVGAYASEAHQRKPAATSSIDSLSDRELEVLRLVAQCLSTRQIAASSS
jgi:DNA-binding NarL/FixJ family response regulator